MFKLFGSRGNDDKGKAVEDKELDNDNAGSGIAQQSQKHKYDATVCASNTKTENEENPSPRRRHVLSSPRPDYRQERESMGYSRQRSGRRQRSRSDDSWSSSSSYSSYDSYDDSRDTYSTGSGSYSPSTRTYTDEGTFTDGTFTDGRTNSFESASADSSIGDEGRGQPSTVRGGNSAKEGGTRELAQSFSPGSSASSDESTTDSDYSMYESPKARETRDYTSRFLESTSKEQKNTSTKYRTHREERRRRGRSKNTSPLKVVRIPPPPREPALQTSPRAAAIQSPRQLQREKSPRKSCATPKARNGKVRSPDKAAKKSFDKYGIDNASKKMKQSKERNANIKKVDQQAAPVSTKEKVTSKKFHKGHTTADHITSAVTEVVASASKEVVEIVREASIEEKKPQKALLSREVEVLEPHDDCVEIIKGGTLDEDEIPQNDVGLNESIPDTNSFGPNKISGSFVTDGAWKELLSTPTQVLGITSAGQELQSTKNMEEEVPPNPSVQSADVDDTNIKSNVVARLSKSNDMSSIPMDVHSDVANEVPQKGTIEKAVRNKSSEDTNMAIHPSKSAHNGSTASDDRSDVETMDEVASTGNYTTDGTEETISVVERRDDLWVHASLQDESLRYILTKNSPQPIPPKKSDVSVATTEESPKVIEQNDSLDKTTVSLQTKEYCENASSVNNVENETDPMFPMVSDPILALRDPLDDLDELGNGATAFTVKSERKFPVLLAPSSDVDDPISQLRREEQNCDVDDFIDQDRLEYCSLPSNSSKETAGEGLLAGKFSDKSNERTDNEAREKEVAVTDEYIQTKNNEVKEQKQKEDQTLAEDFSKLVALSSSEEDPWDVALAPTRSGSMVNSEIEEKAIFSEKTKKSVNEPTITLPDVPTSPRDEASADGIPFSPADSVQSLEDRMSIGTISDYNKSTALVEAEDVVQQAPKPPENVLLQIGKTANSMKARGEGRLDFEAESDQGSSEWISFPADNDFSPRANKGKSNGPLESDSVEPCPSEELVDSGKGWDTHANDNHEPTNNVSVGALLSGDVDDTSKRWGASFQGENGKAQSIKPPISPRKRFVETIARQRIENIRTPFSGSSGGPSSAEGGVGSPKEQSVTPARVSPLVSARGGGSTSAELGSSFRRSQQHLTSTRIAPDASPREMAARLPQSSPLLAEKSFRSRVINARPVSLTVATANLHEEVPSGPATFSPRRMYRSSPRRGGRLPPATPSPRGRTRANSMSAAGAPSPELDDAVIGALD